ncbi:MAG: DUF4911 domain-containing protein [Deferrisomatales bacterium]|nr:DUF4911 domain-containing protein [Deferrisomatales bacterium]
MSQPPGELWALCRAPRKDLVYLRYTLEAYEGLCVATTVPAGGGLVELRSSADRRDELEEVLASLAREIPLVVEGWGEGAP